MTNINIPVTTIKKFGEAHGKFLEVASELEKPLREFGDRQATAERPAERVMANGLLNYPPNVRPNVRPTVREALVEIVQKSGATKQNVGVLQAMYQRLAEVMGDILKKL